MPTELLPRLQPEFEFRHSRRGVRSDPSGGPPAGSYSWAYGDGDAWPSSPAPRHYGGVFCFALAYGMGGSCIGRTLLSSCQTEGSVSTLLAMGLIVLSWRLTTAVTSP